MKVRRVSITLRIFLITTLLILAADAILGIAIYRRSSSLLMEQIKENAKSIAVTAAAAVDGAMLAQAVEEGPESEAYDGVISSLALFRDNSGVEFIYTLVPASGSGAMYAVDADEEDPAEMGSEFDASDATLAAFKGTAGADDEPYTDEWGEHLSAYAPVFDGANVTGCVTVDMSFTWVSEQLSRLLRMIVLICLIVFAVSIIIVVFVSIYLRSSFAKLGAKLSDLTDGSGDLTKEIDLRSGDEFEAIGTYINRFTGQVRHLVSEVAGTSRSIAEAQEHVQGSIGQNVRTISEMGESILSISANMEECSATTESVSTELGGVNDRVSAFAKKIGEVEHETSEANVRAEGASRMAVEHRDKAMAEISRIDNAIKEANEEAKSIEQVREIAAHINDIASQTKILSLNAQVEAARAGEQGKGFAVVATEVEKLSNAITSAVAEITNINNTVIAAVESLSQNSMSMTGFIEESVVGDYDRFVEIGRDYGETMKTVQAHMSDMKEESDTIADTIMGVDESIRGITTAVNDTASMVEQLTANSGAISEEIRSLERSSVENVEQSNRLNEDIRKYKF